MSEEREFLNINTERNNHHNDYRAHTCGILILVVFIALICAAQLAFFAVMAWESYHFAEVELPQLKKEINIITKNVTEFASRLEEFMKNINTGVDALYPFLSLIAKCSCKTENCMCGTKMLEYNK